jgi:hypothetical protein
MLRRSASRAAFGALLIAVSSDGSAGATVPNTRHAKSVLIQPIHGLPKMRLIRITEVSDRLSAYVSL